MKKKTKIRLAAYALTAAAALGGLSWAGQRGLEGFRSSARYSAGRAFEETVAAVDALSEALAESRYATDGGLCCRLCAEAYASASAAESAMSVLPFSTQELERLSAFLNTAGDYAHSLCGEAAEQGFSRQQRQELTELAELAGDFARTLRETQGGVNDGSVVMDSREKRLRNVGGEPGEKLSARLLDYEAGFRPPEELRYDGPYGCEKRRETGYLTEEEMLAEAAAFAGVPPEELRLVYRYEGIDGRRCFRTGDSFLCVSRCGVRSMTQSRLVSEIALGGEEALEIARGFLAARGYGDLELEEQRQEGALSLLRFVGIQDGAVCPDNAVTLAIALDDGSVYSFSAEDYRAERAEVEWTVEEEQAAQTLPEGVTAEQSRRVILRSPGGQDRACYEFLCTDDEGRGVKICVDARTGKQCRIEL